MELKKLNSQRINDPMKKNGQVNWTEIFSEEEVQMSKKTREEMLNIPGHKGNANQ
jgi:hypothetical protein